MLVRFALLLVPVLVGAEPSDYAIAPAPGGRLQLEVEKTGFLRGKKHLFLFERYHGRLHYDRQKPEKSRVELAIASASAMCKDTWLSAKDLKKVQDYALNDMLAAARYPELKFVSTAVRPVAPGRFEVQGMLTIRDQTRPVTVTVDLKSAPDGRLAFSGGAEIRLKDFGLKPPSAALGTIGTKNEMQFSFALTAIPPNGTGRTLSAMERLSRQALAHLAEQRDSEPTPSATRGALDRRWRTFSTCRVRTPADTCDGT